MATKASSEVGMAQQDVAGGRTRTCCRQKNVVLLSYNITSLLMSLPSLFAKGKSYHASDVYLPNLTDRFKTNFVGPKTYADSVETQLKAHTSEISIISILYI